jgi:uncharacterized damage-inducible protein DinB
VKRVLQVVPPEGYPADVGRWLWALQDVRRITTGTVAGLDLSTLDWRGPDGRENSIGTLLYHVALVEMSWLFLDVLERPFPDEVKADFPFDMASRGGLTRVEGVGIAEHLARAERSRAVLLAHLREMTLDDFRRLRAPDGVDYEVTAEWALYHLVEHEAGHAYQMRSLKRRAVKHLGSSTPG